MNSVANLWQDHRAELLPAVIERLPEVMGRPGHAEAPTEMGAEFVPLHAMVEDAERRHIRSALERTGGSVMKTSALLGISRKAPWEKMKKLKLGAA